MTRWQPPHELVRLLDALSEEILTATDEEVRQMHGWQLAMTAGEVDVLVKTACAEAEGRATEGLGTGPVEPGVAPQSDASSARLSQHQRH